MIEVLARRKFKIGRQFLYKQDGKFYMSIVNRTYHSIQEVPEERVPLWLEALRFRGKYNEHQDRRPGQDRPR